MQTKIYMSPIVVPKNWKKKIPRRGFPLINTKHIAQPINLEKVLIKKAKNNLEKLYKVCISNNNFSF